MSTSPHVLIIDARFYEAISDELMGGALAALKRARATYDRVSVPGALEIPAALAMAVESPSRTYDGFVVLGCVIRGETTHYEIVAEQSARALIDLSVRHRLPLGNGILTVETEGQAMARAKLSGNDKGGEAARTALAMIDLRQHLQAPRRAG